MIITSIFYFTLALVFACVEIEAEGKYGWASKMPTWYRTTGFFGRLYGLIMRGKPLTGYHSFMFFLPLMIFHSKFVSGVEWSPEAEAMTMALYFAWCPVWDFLWFVLNPYFGIASFKSGNLNVWWHVNDFWFLRRIPMSYVISWAISIIIAISVGYLTAKQEPISEHFKLLIAFTVLTCLTILFTPMYHWWYYSMRENDDRDRLGL